MQAKLFKNFSTEDFTWKHDGIPYTFKAGQEMFMEDFKSNHFAKHLIDRELNRKEIPTNNLSERAKLEALCFPSDEVVSEEEAVHIEAIKKVKAKKSAKKEKVEEEEEFADLEEDK